jgi:cobalt-zinc-cadmium efflux system outer membrane protein
MRTSFVTLAIAALLIIAASPGLVEPSEPSDSELARASAKKGIEGHITLEQAVSRALKRNPALAAGTSAVSAAEARITQAGLFPNPELELETENFGGSGELDGFNAAESTAVVSQPILLGGKRRHRRSVAESERTLAGRDLEAVRLDVTAGVTAAFYQVLAAQRREALADELLALAERFAGTVQKRVDAGKVSPVEATRASIEVSQARVGLARAVRELEAARALLAANWGSSTADFDLAVGELPELIDPPSLGPLRQHLLKVPEITRLEDQIERERRALELERSFRIPDLTISVGPRRFEETGESAWVAGISLPIPIFDRNQGARRAAEFELERTRRDAEANRVGLEAELTSTLERLRAVTLEATTMSQEIVPAARSAFAATQAGYREGKLGFLDVLDAQRALFETRSLLLDSREEYAITRAELERLIGRPLSLQRAPSPPEADTSQGEER